MSRHVPHRTGAFVLLAAIQFVLILAMSVLNMALPVIERDFSLGRVELALLNAAYGMSFSGLLLLGGRLCHLYGSRRVLISGVAAFGLGSVVAALAPGAPVLLAARFTQGAGAAMAVPAAMALVGIIYPDRAAHARAMALWGGLAAFGGTAGMLLSGVVLTFNSWRWALVVPIVVAALAMATARRLLPAGPPPERGRLDLLGAVLVTGGICLPGFGMVQAAELGWGSWSARISLLAGCALLLAAIAVERRTEQPILPLPLLASSGRGVALVAVFLAASGITTVFFFLPLYFQQVRHYTPMAASVAFLPFGAALVVTGISVGGLVHRLGAKVVTVAGLFVGAGGLWLLSQMTTGSPYAGVVLGGLLLFAVGVGLVFSGSTVIATAGVPQGQAGQAGAVVNTAMEGGPAVGLVLLVTVAVARTDVLGLAGTEPASAQTQGYALALAVAAAAFGVAGLVGSVLLRASD